MAKVIDSYSFNDNLVPYYVARNCRSISTHKNAQIIAYICSVNHSGSYELLGDNIKNACTNVIVGSMQRRGFYASDTNLFNYVPRIETPVPALESNSSFSYGSYLDFSLLIQKKTSEGVVSTLETLNVTKELEYGTEPFVIIVGFDKRDTNDKDVYISQYAAMTTSDVQASVDSLKTYLTNLGYVSSIDAYLYSGTQTNLASFSSGDKRVLTIQSSLKRTRDYGSNEYTLATGEVEAVDSETDGLGGSIANKFVKATTVEVTPS